MIMKLLFFFLDMQGKGLAVWLVANCMALYYKVAEKFKRTTNLEFTSISAILYILCTLLLFFSFII